MLSSEFLPKNREDPPQRLQSQQKGWTQQKLAEKAGLSYNTITKIEQGIAEHPNLKTLLKLADAFGVGLDSLTGRKT